MKKVLSILFASLILLSGMHLSVATHFCHGKVAAVRWSFSDKIAGCGMESSKPVNNKHNIFTSNCCQNKIAFFKVDKNFSPNTIHNKDVAKNILKVFYVPLNLPYNSLIALNTVHANISPPDNFLVSAVNLANVCVLRI